MKLTGRPAHAAALALLSVASNTFAAQWSVAPAITLRETYTDNASLAAEPTEGDYITEVAPGIAIQGTGARFRASLNYTANAIFHARNSGEDRLANTLSAFGNLEAVESFFFVDANASISQQFISPFAPRPANVTAISPNRTETRTFGISPYVRGQLGSALSYELRNRNTWTSADAGGLADVYTRQWSASLGGPVRVFGWSLEYDESTTRYDDAGILPEQKSRLYRGRLFFQPDPEWLLFASAGREQNNYTPEQERSYTTYGGGVTWRPSARTQADFQWERRFFGTSRSARLSHRTRLTAWSAAYSKSVSSFQQQLLLPLLLDSAALFDSIFAARIPDPVARRAAVEEFLRVTGIPAVLVIPITFYTQNIFLQERLEGSVGILGVRNSLTFTAFSAKSTALTQTFSPALPDAFFAGGSRIRQHGFGFNASHRLTGFTSLGAGGSRIFARSEEPATLSSRSDFFSLSLNRTLSPKTTTFAGLSYSRFTSTGAATTYARSAFVGLTHRF
jgi:uncharacterized protein (PEP-CTERM system associated)